MRVVSVFRRMSATLLLMCVALVSTCTLRADAIGADAAAWQYSSSSDLPSGLSGWFYNSTGPLFPAQTDSSKPWTSASNLALMNSWLDLVNGAAGDLDALAKLIGLGRYDSPSELSSQIVLDLNQQLPAAAPEPPMLGLLACGLVLLSLYRWFRCRQLARATIHATRLKPHVQKP